MSSYRFRAPAPVRALLISAVACSVGAVAAVAPLQAGWPTGAAVPGFLLLALGLAQAVFALVQQARQTASITLDDEGWEVATPRQRRRGRWADVTRIVTDDRARLSIESTDGVVHIVRPAGVDGAAQWQGLERELARRLDGNRGYRNFA